mgnify:CR=1 FL=1
MENPLHQKAFLLLLALVTAAFAWLMLPFYGAVLWAVILAIVFQPMQRSFEKQFWPRRNLAALVSTLICVVIAVIPVPITVAALVDEDVRFPAQRRDLDLVQTTIEPVLLNRGSLALANGHLRGLRIFVQREQCWRTSIRGGRFFGTGLGPGGSGRKSQ